MSANVMWPGGRRGSARLRSARLVVTAVVVALGLAGCGGSDEARRATAADVSQTESLAYVAAAEPDEVRTVPVVLGKIVLLTVTSDVPGEVRIDGYHVTHPVQPGTPAFLIFSADRPGVFDVQMRREGTDVAFAQLEVEEA